MNRRALAILPMIAVVSICALPSQALAGGSGTNMHLRSIEWVPRTGNVVVTAEVRCSGPSSMRWQVAVVQGDRHDLGSKNVPCDGQRRTQTIVLNSHSKRYHAGNADLEIGTVICGSSDCYGGIAISEIRLRPNN